MPETSLLKEWSASKVRLEPETLPSTKALEDLTFKLPLPETSETSVPERLIVPASVSLITATSPAIASSPSSGERPEGINVAAVCNVAPSAISTVPPLMLTSPPSI